MVFARRQVVSDIVTPAQRETRLLIAFYDCIKGLVDQAQFLNLDVVHVSTLARLLEDFQEARWAFEAHERNTVA
jgi:hypothetical protein